MQEEQVVITSKFEDVLEFMPSTKALEDMSVFFSAFADSTRLKILTALSVKQMCVSDLSQTLRINQTTISHQLKLLRTLKFVDFKRDGKQIFYYLSNKNVNEVMLSGVNYIFS